MSYDGSLKFDTAIDTKGFKKDLSEIKKISKTPVDVKVSADEAKKEVKKVQQELEKKVEMTLGLNLPTQELESFKAALNNTEYAKIIDSAPIKKEAKVAEAAVVSAAKKADTEAEKAAKNIEKNAKKSFDNAANSATDMSRKIVNAFKAVALGYTGKKLIDYFIGSNSEMEQYLTSFEVLLGSASNAKKLMDDLTQFANVTPLELTDVTKSAQMLMNYGVAADDVISKLTQLGDLSGGNAVKLDRISLAYGQMLAKGKVTGEELRQMTEAGVPLLQALADSIGVSTAELQKMISAGRVGIPELNGAIANLTTGTGKFAGMMEKQAQTMTGMLSTLKDSLTQFGRDAGEKAFDEVKGSLKDLMDMLAQAQEDGTLADIAEDIGVALNALIKALINVTEFVVKYRKAILAGAAAMATFKASMAIGNVITSLTVAYKGLAGATLAAKTAQVALNAVTKANPIGLAIGAVATLTAGVVWLVKNIDTAAESVAKVKKEIADAEKTISDANSKLDVNAQTIDEIKNKGVITYTDEMEIKKLEIANAELQKTIDLENERIRILNQEKSEKAMQALNGVESGSIQFVEEYIAEYNQAKQNLEDYMNGLKPEWGEVTAQGIENLENTVEQYRVALESGATTMQSFSDEIIVIDAESRDAKNAVAGLVEQLKQLGLASDETIFAAARTAGEYYEESARRAYDASGLASVYNRTVDEQLERLEQSKNAMYITEAEYYAKSRKILEENNKGKFGEYNRYWANILSFEKSQGEKWLKEQDDVQAEWFRNWKSDINSLASQSEVAFNKILSAQESFKSKLFDTSDLFGYDDDDKLYLTDIAKKTAQLRDYQTMLDRLRSYEGSDGLSEYIKGLNVTDAVTNLEGILSGNTQLYIQEFNEFQDTAAKIAENEYADDLNAVKDDFVDKVGEEFLGLAGVAGQAGTDAAEAFRQSILNNTDGVHEAVRKLLEASDIGELSANIKGQIAAEKARTATAMMPAPTAIPSSTAQTAAQSGKISVPVTINLDGRTIAEVVAEYTPQIEYERGN